MRNETPELIILNTNRRILRGSIPNKHVKHDWSSQSHIWSKKSSKWISDITTIKKRSWHRGQSQQVPNNGGVTQGTVWGQGIPGSWSWVCLGNDWANRGRVASPCWHQGFVPTNPLQRARPSVVQWPVTTQHSPRGHKMNPTGQRSEI